MKKQLIRELQSTLERRAQANPRYSLRAFARDLQMDPSVLSKILLGNRGISSGNLVKLCKGLGYSDEQTQVYLSQLARAREVGAEKRLCREIASGAIIKELWIRKDLMPEFLARLEQLRTEILGAGNSLGPAEGDSCLVSFVYSSEEST